VVNKKIRIPKEKDPMLRVSRTMWILKIKRTMKAVDWARVIKMIKVDTESMKSLII